MYSLSIVFDDPPAPAERVELGRDASASTSFLSAPARLLLPVRNLSTWLGFHEGIGDDHQSTYLITDCAPPGTGDVGRGDEDYVVNKHAAFLSILARDTYH